MPRTLHITGSAGADCDAVLLRETHSFVDQVVSGWTSRGGTIVAGVAGSPTHQDDSDLSIIFDWTVISAVARAVRQGGAQSYGTNGPALVLRGSRRAYEQVPEWGAALLTDLTEAGALDLRLLPDTWRSGALVRREQADVGGILMTLSGGAGVEDLVNLYAANGRPVVPIDVSLGSSQRDGAQGGGTGLARRAMSNPAAFLRLADGSPPGARLAALSMGGVRPAPAVLAERALKLLNDLELPRAFCVRLLNADHEHFGDVERFFRDVSDPVLSETGLRVIDLSQERQDGAWMNAEIFEHIYRSDTVLVDLTGQRPNCYMELGYALGRGHRIIVTARAGERLPFDADKLPCHFWSTAQPSRESQDLLREHLRKFGTRAPLVAAARLVG
ncbi:hypothetical protein OJ998_30075 [Solirubrobacter taibaiensis]|nr:hypothetical protein [Solirubrobacter taibaiensis]